MPAALRSYRVTVISSDDDPYATKRYTEEQTAGWCAEHIHLRQRGHINATSGLGDGTDGWAIANYGAMNDIEHNAGTSLMQLKLMPPTLTKK